MLCAVVWCGVVWCCVCVCGGKWVRNERSVLLAWTLWLKPTLTLFHLEEGGLGGGGLDTVSDHPWSTRIPQVFHKWSIRINLGVKEGSRNTLVIFQSFFDALWTPFDRLVASMLDPFGWLFGYFFGVFFEMWKKVLPQRCFWNILIPADPREHRFYLGSRD